MALKAYMYDTSIIALCCANSVAFAKLFAADMYFETCFLVFRVARKQAADAAAFFFALM